MNKYQTALLTILTRNKSDAELHGDLIAVAQTIITQVTKKDTSFSDLHAGLAIRYLDRPEAKKELREVALLTHGVLYTIVTAKLNKMQKGVEHGAC